MKKEKVHLFTKKDSNGETLEQPYYDECLIEKNIEIGLSTYINNCTVQPDLWYAWIYAAEYNIEYKHEYICVCNGVETAQECFDVLSQYFDDAKMTATHDVKVFEKWDDHADIIRTWLDHCKHEESSLNSIYKSLKYMQEFYDDERITPVYDFRNHNEIDPTGELVYISDRWMNHRRISFMIYLADMHRMI